MHVAEDTPRRHMLHLQLVPRSPEQPVRPKYEYFVRYFNNNPRADALEAPGKPSGIAIPLFNIRIDV